MSSNLASPTRPLLSTLVRGVAPAARRARRHDRTRWCNLLKLRRSVIRLSPFVLHTDHAYGRGSAGIPQEIR
jgi:hypothetical protein